MIQVDAAILSDAERPAVDVLNPDGASSVVLVCEHASNMIPQRLENLGLPEAVRAGHMAYDPGALDLAKLMSATLDAPLVTGRVSRLVYDCNRPPEAIDAIVKRGEHEVPGNRNLNALDQARRVDEVYRPFASHLAKIVAAKSNPIIVTVHSFTPIYYGVQREVEIGVLYDEDRRLADAMLPLDTDLNVQRNAPYGPEDGVTHTLKTHALPHGYLNVMIEIANTLLTTDVERRVIADVLCGSFNRAFTSLGVVQP